MSSKSPNCKSCPSSRKHLEPEQFSPSAASSLMERGALLTICLQYVDGASRAPHAIGSHPEQFVRICKNRKWAMGRRHVSRMRRHRRWDQRRLWGKHRQFPDRRRHWGRHLPAIWPILNCMGFQIRNSKLRPDPNRKQLNFEPQHVRS